MQANYITLQEITQRKEELKKEIDLKEERISELTNELFSTSTPKTGAEAIIQHAQSAVWVYDGVMTGVKIVRRFQRFFGTKKKKST
ncbi:MAG: hypothetical protein ACRCUJ_12295 [Phocaeicola sp.]